MGHYGIVYIARNDKHPENVYKIGGSARDVNARMAELNRETATFGKFKPKAFFPVTDWEQAEAKCHRSLSEFREDKKEFFTAPYEQLLKTVRGICEEYTPKVYAQEPEVRPSKNHLEAKTSDQNVDPNFSVTIPTLGDNIEDCLISNWYKDDGDWIEIDDLLFEIETDKVTVEINAQEDGILEIGVEDGNAVKVGQIVATIIKAPMIYKDEDGKIKTRTSSPVSTTQLSQKWATGKIEAKTKTPEASSYSPTAERKATEKKVSSSWLDLDGIFIYGLLIVMLLTWLGFFT